MENLFINIFQMSFSASYLILAVLIVRFLLRKAPKSMRSFLWLLVGIRLVFPFSVESVFSLIPDTQVADEYIYDFTQPESNTILNTANIDTIVSQPVSSTLMPSDEKYVNKTQTAVLICAKIWLAGMALMLGYMLTSWLRLKHR
ncbi:MAG: M56 family metallopeptidase, partial [Lachnospiraceae bacterium]|nr:M56 family metallopeptidase [Lachnospiraceae bacterium]